MATWKLSPQYKKSAVEKMFFYKEGKCITIEQGFRWATFSVQSDERPLTDDELKNEDGYELGSIENDESWEMWDMTDGCWCDIEMVFNDKATSTDLEEFEAAWAEDSYEGVEALGWSQDDCEYYYYGPLVLTNEDTGEVFQGEPEENVSVSGVPHMSNTDNPVDFPSPDLALTEEPELTDWFPASVDPAYKGSYEILTVESSSWPFPVMAEWDSKWLTTETVTEWRGLAKDPSK